MPDWYQAIRFTEEYDRAKFVKAYGKFGDLEGYIQDLEKDPNNPSAASDLGALLHGNARHYEEMNNPINVARFEADRAYSEGANAMAFYVKNNIDKFFERLEDKDLVTLVTNLPLYKTSDEEHNKFIEKINEMKKLGEAAKDPSKANEYVQSKIKKAPKWLQEAFSYFGTRQDYTAALFQEFAQDTQKEFQAEILTEDGKINKNKLEKIVKDSIKVAWDKHDEESNEGDKSDLWKMNIRPYYLTLAKLVYPKEKKEEKYDKDAAREDRKKERRTIGLVA